jgi:hypothetical protein
MNFCVLREFLRGFQWGGGDLVREESDEGALKLESVSLVLRDF